MKNLQALISEIVELTITLEEQYPERYRFLEEDPITIPSVSNPKLDKKAMQEYSNDLKQMIEGYSQTHKPSG